MSKPDDASNDRKTQLRADLRTAMKDRRMSEVKVLRALIATLDNAEAPSVSTEGAAPLPVDFHSGSAEVERLVLSHSQVNNLLLTEIQEREQAATELERVGRADRAEVLRAEIQIVRRYLDSR